MTDFETDIHHLSGEIEDLREELRERDEKLERKIEELAELIQQEQRDRAATINFFLFYGVILLAIWSLSKVWGSIVDGGMMLIGLIRVAIDNLDKSIPPPAKALKVVYPEPGWMEWLAAGVVVCVFLISLAYVMRTPKKEEGEWRN
jgi:hypothetical protein